MWTGFAKNYGHETNETIDDITRKNSLLKQIITNVDPNAQEE
jgi:hypothetical protein